MASPDDSWLDSYDAWKLASPPEERESDRPDWCATCEEIHAEGCPLDFCEGCGFKSCQCDWDED